MCIYITRVGQTLGRARCAASSAAYQLSALPHPLSLSQVLAGGKSSRESAETAPTPHPPRFLSAKPLGVFILKVSLPSATKIISAKAQSVGRRGDILFFKPFPFLSIFFSTFPTLSWQFITLHLDSRYEIDTRTTNGFGEKPEKNPMDTGLRWILDATRKSNKRS